MSYSNKPDWMNWIEEAISKKHIKHYDYNDFSNLKEIGAGGFGTVYRANWKNFRNILALKSLNNSTAEKIVYELKIQRDVDFHENIIRFLGITIDKQNYSSMKYMLVMEYADSGSLRKYLEKNVGNLNWNDKFKLAHQLACAISCLHDENIIHRDLHSSNVLVHQNNIKLADFGLSKKINDPSASQQGGVIPYIDPKKFGTDSYSLNQKSDVYSIGVLLWEISSCRPPFENVYNKLGLPNQILQGLRETPTPNTPKDYEKLYTDCWKSEPYVRPTIHNVVASLETIINNTSKWTPPINNSSHSSRNNLSQSFKQKGSKSKKDIVDGIATLPYKLYDRNKKQKILDYLEDHHVTSKEIFDWLLNNRNYPNSLLVLGDFYYLGIATKVDKKMAFKFYERAGDGDDGLSVAQYNLGVICENDKLGDTFLAMYWYQKSAEQGNHEARESFNRLKSAQSKTLAPSTIDKFDDMRIFFP